MTMFPKPTRRPKKKTRELDPDYIEWVHKFNCIVPGCSTPYPVHAHHTTSRGAGGSDRTAVPLCANHHTGLHGIHNLGQIHWQKKFGVVLEDEVARLNTAYEKGQKGPNQKLNIIS